MEEVSLGEGLPGSALGRLEESLPRDMDLLLMSHPELLTAV